MILWVYFIGGKWRKYVEGPTINLKEELERQQAEEAAALMRREWETTPRGSCMPGFALYIAPWILIIGFIVMSIYNDRPISSRDVDTYIQTYVGQSAYIYSNSDWNWFGKSSLEEDAYFFIARCNRTNEIVSCDIRNTGHVPGEEWLRRQQLEGGPEGGAHAPPSNLLTINLLEDR